MKIKILQLGKLDISYRGGIEKVVSNIHSLLSDKFSVYTLCLGNKNLKKKKLTISKINFSFSSFYFSIDYLAKIFKLRKKFDILIGHMPNPLCIILLILPRKYILFWHSDVINKNLILNILYKPFEIILIFFSRRIIFTSKTYREASYAKIFNRPYSIIPLSTKTIDNFGPRNKSKNRILSVGRLVSYKNYIFLLKAIKELPLFTLTIVGNGPEHKKLKEFISLNNIKNVHILTSINDTELSKIYKSHDIFCLASNTRAEAFGVVLIEALSYGLPILVGNNIGSGMISVCKNRNGLVFNYSIDDFKKKLNFINKNYSFFSKKAFYTFNSNFSNQRFKENISSAIVSAKKSPV